MQGETRIMSPSNQSATHSIVASVTYSFKGEVHTLSLQLDLDTFGTDLLSPGVLHHLLATDNALDTYSYEFEIMEMAEITFSDPVGHAVDFFHQGTFDLAGYVAARENYFDWTPLRAIAAEWLQVTDLDSRPELAGALKAAYLSGLEQCRKVENG
jgi:hypothetical protein